MVTGGDDELAPSERTAEVLEERSRGGHGIAERPVAQLEYVAEQDQAIDIGKRRQQRSTQVLAAQHVRTGGAAQVQVGDDQRAHGSADNRAAPRLRAGKAERMRRQPEKFKLRKTLAEHPFGTIKRWFGYTHFLLKGLAKVQCEWSLTTLAYNLKRVLNLVSFQELMAAVA